MEKLGRLRRKLPAVVRGVLRRQSEILLPDRQSREYRRWMGERMKKRDSLCTDPLQQGLLSVLTPVWNQSPLRYLKVLAESVIAQNPDGACEWVILDNGCVNPNLRSYLAELNAYTWVKVHRLETNIGIIAGLRHCLEHATGRYVLPVDADDCLYPDAFRVIASFVSRTGYPALLYTDEDKLIGTKFFDPYLKPDWDPVLLLNSAYIAHLGIIHREKALELGAYTDSKTEGSPDWDLFIRFMLAGYTAVHIPEVLYSWRVHARSTADDAASKPYVHASQKAVLQKFLDTQANPEKFSIEYSPLLGGAAHWHFRRKRDSGPRITSVVLTQTGSTANVVSLPVASQPGCLAVIAREAARQSGFVHLVGADVAIEDPEWPWEALALFELHPDTVMIGGRIRNQKGIITEAGRYFGFAGPCGCPNRSKSVLDPGYFAQMWKQRSVSAVSTQFAVVNAAFLLELLDSLPDQASLAFLGAWAGARAMRSGKRIIYSPFLSGVSDLDWDSLVRDSEKDSFAKLNHDLIPDRRYYSRHLSLEKPFALAS